MYVRLKRGGPVRLFFSSANQISRVVPGETRNLRKLSHKIETRQNQCKLICVLLCSSLLLHLKRKEALDDYTVKFTKYPPNDAYLNWISDSVLYLWRMRLAPFPFLHLQHIIYRACYLGTVKAQQQLTRYFIVLIKSSSHFKWIEKKCTIFVRQLIHHEKKPSKTRQKYSCKTAIAKMYTPTMNQVRHG